MFCPIKASKFVEKYMGGEGAKPFKKIHMAGLP
jgi:hypothetical protein